MLDLAGQKITVSREREGNNTIAIPTRNPPGTRASLADKYLADLGTKHLVARLREREKPVAEHRKRPREQDASVRPRLYGEKRCNTQRAEERERAATMREEQGGGQRHRTTEKGVGLTVAFAQKRDHFLDERCTYKSMY